MYRNVNSYLKFLRDNKLSQSQYIFLYLLRYNNTEGIAIYKEAFPTDDKTLIGELNKQDLINRGFIEQVGNENRVSDYKITEKFNKLFLKDKFTAAQEIVNLYPSVARMNGTHYPLINMDLYEFANTYAERIGYSIEEHLEVIKDVEFARKNELLTTGLEKFVKGELWMKFRQLRLGSEKIVTAVNITDSF